MFGIRCLQGIKNILVVSAFLLLTACKPEYSGDGLLTKSHGILWTPIYTIRMPEVEIFRACTNRYDLKDIPSSKAFYSIALVVPSSGEITPAERQAWGTCHFEIKKNGQVVQSSGSSFSEMINWRTKEFGVYLNSLYIENLKFTASDPSDHWELIFKCSGFDSRKSVAGYIFISSGGE